MVTDFIPIIICGGEGKRLWPVSSKDHPKQFIPLFKNKSLFDLTIERVKKLTLVKPIIIASKDNKKNISSALKKQNIKAKVILEEVGRNTTAAITFGLFYVKEAGSETPKEPTHKTGDSVNVPDDLAEAVIEAAEECPGECIFVEAG